MDEKGSTELSPDCPAIMKTGNKKKQGKTVQIVCRIFVQPGGFFPRDFLYWVDRISLNRFLCHNCRYFKLCLSVAGKSFVAVFYTS